MHNGSGHFACSRAGPQGRSSVRAGIGDMHVERKRPDNLAWGLLSDGRILLAKRERGPGRMFTRRPRSNGVEVFRLRNTERVSFDSRLEKMRCCRVPRRVSTARLVGHPDGLRVRFLPQHSVISGLRPAFNPASSCFHSFPRSLS
jgi:hypothetical protein